MRLSVLYGLLVIATVPAWSQVEPSATGGTAEPANETRMMLPPPVSGATYPNVVGSETRSNFISGGLALEGAYDDNVYAGILSKPLSETILSILPTFSYDRTTAQQTQMLTYSPGFTFYVPTSALSAINQSAQAEYDYRFSSYTGVSIQDKFTQTSNTFGLPGAFSGGGISGSAGSLGQALIIPYADILSNALRGSFDKQFSRNQMFGGSGTFGLINYPNPSQAPDLFDSKTIGGSAFFSQRITRSDYVGLNYGYSRTTANPPDAQSVSQTNAILPFLTLYFNRTMSLSVAGGAQHYNVAQTGLPTASAWTPSGSVSAGIQTEHTNLAVSYLRDVTAGDGLLGAYIENAADLSGRWQLNRSWIVGASADYAIEKNVTPAIPNANPGGHRISGDAFVSRSFGDHFGAELRYHRLHQSYSGIAILASNPDSDSFSVALSYQFKKPLGR